MDWFPVVTGTIASTITLATPLLLAALGETVVQKAGVVNVGLEGIMLFGAFAATLAARPLLLPLLGPTENPLLGVAAAAVVGIAVALLFALFAVKLAANQVVVGVVINLLAVGLTGTIYRAVFGETGSFISIKTLPLLTRLPDTLTQHSGGRGLLGVLAAILRQNALCYVALAAVPLVWWWLNHTRGGLELRACGEQPVAADAAGVNVARVRTLALAYGGLMAGIAGACLSVGDVGTFKEEMTAGRGFIALAIVTSGRWHPAGCLIAAIVFGLAQALQFQLQAAGIRVSSQIFLALPYLVTLFILLTGSRLSQAPAALGRPYRKQ